MTSAQSDSRKQQILEAAMTVFARKGFDGASMDDIVQESGISKGGLYWHFNSKDDIIAAILRQFFDHEMESLEELVSGDGPAGARLQALTVHLAEEMQEAFRLLPISLEFYAVAARQETVREWMRDYFDRYHTLITELLRQGAQKGEFGIRAPEEAAVTLIALYEGLVLLWAVMPETIDLKADARRAVQLLLWGLQNESNRVEPDSDPKGRP